MRKIILEAPPAQISSRSDENWLDVEKLASVLVTSEDPVYPIESVFSNRGCWRAAEEGEQVIRIVFDEAQAIHRIWLRFSETKAARTQQFTLRCSGPEGQAFQEIARQQWNFSPDASTEELEDYRVKLNGVSILELTIQPEITAGKAIASLAGWRIA